MEDPDQNLALMRHGVWKIVNGTEVAPDEKLKDLLFWALWPDLHDVWSKMIRLHYE